MHCSPLSFLKCNYKRLVSLVRPQTFADAATAKAAGLSVGQFYVTSGGDIKQVV